MKKKIDKYYSSAKEDEWNRLVKDTYHQLELNTTLKYLYKHLPKDGLILDAGGGPGRYTIELAKKGYQMVLLDITQELLKKAKKKIKKYGVEDNIKDIVQGSITDLGKFSDESFDAVLCLGGPLSHVENEEERKKAVNELVRVAKKGAPIFISVIGRLGVLLKMLKYWPDEMELTDHFNKLWKDGDDDMWRMEYYCHFFLPGELSDIVKSAGVEIVEKVGLEGLAHFKEDTKNVSEKYPKAWENWLAMNEIMCIDPNVFATSDHMLIVARKK